jgi:uncharacterized protein
VTIEGRERLAIPGPAGVLEAIAHEAQGTARALYGIVCHPHPVYGGTMDNKVVYTLARALQTSGVATLRFNFRGVGASEGAYDEGAGETQDAAAVADFGLKRWPNRRLVLAGFSFGAFVALRLALSRDTDRLITVAPPVGRFDFSKLQAPACPWLVVQGDADELVDPNAVIDWVSRQVPPPELRVVPGVGHFFHGHLTDLRDAVIETLRSG